MVRQALAPFGCVLVAVGFALPSAASAACHDIMPGLLKGATAERAVTAKDLIELREIGSPDSASFASPTPFAVSPDGTRVAYIINRADLATNSYCRALVVSSVRVPGPPKVLDRGGELIKLIDVQRGFYLPSGATQVVTPVWSPDASKLAYLRRDDGITQAWVANVDGSGAHAVSRAAIDVQTLAWSRDGKRVIFGTIQDQAAAERAIDREGRAGWLYDERVSPDISARPSLKAINKLDIFAADLHSGRITAADRADQAILKSPDLPGRPHDPQAVADDGRRAWVERRDASPLAPAVLTANSPTGTKVTCDAAQCARNILSIWWDGDTVVFLRREGWAKGTMALYRWSVGGGNAPKPVLRTDDVLHGCVKARLELICTRENSRTPRRVVAIDMRTATEREIFDPNPEYERTRIPRVIRLKWRNDLGLEAWGDLVLPPQYRPGAKLPLIVTQYHSDGFLRGGTGDEYPIFLFAEHGFAVLSTERSAPVATAYPNLETWDEIIAVGQKDWAERRSLLSSVLTGVGMTIDHGYVDASRVGITGLSDGATTVAFALINSDAFAAAAMSTCCMEPNTTMTYGGIAWADWLRRVGYPPATANDRNFWRNMSIAQNAAHIDTPLLMHLSDAEFRLALEAFSALREQNKPVEMYVFPDELHIKSQPAHRLAVYERNLEWFDFWLRGVEKPDPTKADQYARWEAMRERQVPPH